MKCLLTTATIVSGVVCCLLVMVLPVSYRFDLWKSDNKSKRLVPNDCSITIAPHFCLEFYNGGVLLFSGESPFLNGTRHVGDEKGILYKNGHARAVRDLYWHVGDYVDLRVTLIGERDEFVEADRHFDFPGIRHRYFNVADNPPADWTLMVSLWYPISIFAVLPALWFYRRVRLRFKQP